MSDSVSHLRLGFTAIHLILVVIGFLNVLIVIMIMVKPYLRSITNVYMLGLCLADFIYVTDLVFVPLTQFNNKNWPFGETMCCIYHFTETTAKYATVLFITLLAADRYFAICKSEVARGYRSYYTAVTLSISAWTIAILFSLPLYMYAVQKTLIHRPKNSNLNGTIHLSCRIDWKNPNTATWYIGVCSVVIFILPGCIVFWCYYQVFCKLRDHIKGARRIHRQNSTRYRKVTQMVQRVVLFHLLCWSPFWMFNLVSTLFGMRISSLFEKIIINIIHLFPYINCAVNPILYAHSAENFRTAFREMFLCQSRERGIEPLRSTTRSTCCRNSSNLTKVESLATNGSQRNGLLVPVPEALSMFIPEDDFGIEHADDVDGRVHSITSGEHLLQVRYQDHKASATSLIIPAITVPCKNEGTAL